MGSIKHIIVALSLCLPMHCFANNDSTVHLKQTGFVTGNFANFYADNLGNIFCITADNQVKKLNTKGDSLGVFNDVKQYGKIYSIDVSNPLKILIYYRDFSTVLLLDRFLNVISVIDLRQSQILQARAVAQSYDGNIWVYDDLDAMIKKLDYNGNILQQSADFRLLFDDAFSPAKIIDNNGQLFLYDIKFGWKIFDYYNGFKKNIPYLGWRDVQVSDNYLSGRDSVYFYYAQASEWENTKAISGIDLANVLKVQLQTGQLFALKKDGIYIYSITEH
jgi:hypothetical protein